MDTSDIKQSLSEFIQKSLKSSTTYGFRDGTAVNLNRSIYEIQHHLRVELERCSINTYLDSKIISNSILASFNRTEVTAHKSQHYAFPFLKYIYGHFSAGKELLTYIDDFIYQNREQLTWPDIVITESGATRCKTNIRFALKLLRDLNLTRSRNKNDKRTVMPTVIGQLIVHYMDWVNGKSKYARESEWNLSHNAYLHFSGHLNRLKEPLVLTDFLQSVKQKLKLEAADSSKIDEYLTAFQEVILSALTITDKGISYTSDLRKSDAYQNLLSALNEESLFLPIVRG